MKVCHDLEFLIIYCLLFAPNVSMQDSKTIKKLHSQLKEYKSLGAATKRLKGKVYVFCTKGFVHDYADSHFGIQCQEIDFIFKITRM
jgi:hypothetical protein